MEKSIDLKLSVNEFNQVLNALASQPYVQVFTLIEKLQGAAKESLSEDTKKAAGTI
jgi:hypothetical protein